MVGHMCGRLKQHLLILVKALMARTNGINLIGQVGFSYVEGFDWAPLLKDYAFPARYTVWIFSLLRFLMRISCLKRRLWVGFEQFLALLDIFPVVEMVCLAWFCACLQRLGSYCSLCHAYLSFLTWLEKKTAFNFNEWLVYLRLSDPQLCVSCQNFEILHLQAATADCFLHPLSILQHILD